MVSNIFYFHPYLGKISNLTNIFQRGWNHQLGRYIGCWFGWHFMDWILLPLDWILQVQVSSCFIQNLANVILIICLLLQKNWSCRESIQETKIFLGGRHGDHIHLHAGSSLVLQVFTRYIVMLFQDWNYDRPFNTNWERKSTRTHLCIMTQKMKSMADLMKEFWNYVVFRKLYQGGSWSWCRIWTSREVWMEQSLESSSTMYNTRNHQK